MAPRFATVVLAAALLAGCQSDPDEPERTGPPRDVDLVGLWYLHEAKIDGTRASVPEGAHVTLAVRPRQAQAHEGCSYVSVTPQVNGEQASLEPVGEVSSVLSCLMSFESSTLPAGSYFAALKDVDHAQRVRDALVLTGPDVTLVYELQPRGGVHG